MVENFPRMLKYKDDEFHKQHNKLSEIDDVARARGRLDPRHGEEPFVAILGEPVRAQEGDRDRRLEEQEGRSRAHPGSGGDDDGPTRSGYPQGAKTLRKEDHSGMIDCYISRVENGQFHVKKKIAKEELMAQLPPRFDFSKEAV